MNLERSHVGRSEVSVKRIICANDLPPTQAGLAAAFRCAFRAPNDDASVEFEALLKRIA